ncbi:MAG: CoA transferase [Dehalococcoidia bacterium]|nr:CoA transferase [Dehalococcoidia bacterium]
MSDAPPDRSERGPLHGVRVLDLAERGTEMAGRMLADLGADVLKVEPPGGAAARRMPPFDERPGRGDARASLYWAALGLGKRSLVLDLHLEDDRERLGALAAAADVLIEDAGPGAMDALGLGPAALAERNPRLVYVSISPYGQDGPKAGWPAVDVVVEAAGGRLSVQGDRDRPPVPLGFPNALFHAGAQAAADAVTALNERDRSGLGQHLDLSMQDVMVWTLMDQPAYVTMTGTDPPGGGDDRAQVPGRHERTMARCRDGYVIVTLTREPLGGLMPSVLAGTEPPPALAEVPWEQWPALLQAGRVPQATLDAAQEALGRFFATHTKRELLDWAVSVDLRLAPVQTTRDIVQDDQFQARGFWQPAEGGAPDEPYPGPGVRLSRTPARLGTPAPALGEGGQGTEARWLREPPAPPAVAEASPRAGDRLGESFAGVRIVDFSWVGAGPMTAKALADHGATVVRVESATRPDLLRSLPPFLDGVPGLNRSQWTANVNSSKYGVAVNLGAPEGREVARRLVDWADVVVESFTPGTMARFGLDYETVTRDRDDLIMLSTCLLGQDGPRARYGGYGQHGAALSGLHAITGWPDRPPSGPHGPYTDVITPKFGAAAIAAALYERRRSGQGQHIDLSQVEAALQFVAPLLLDELRNGRTAEAAGHGGHAAAEASPHGVYRTAGAERYLALAVETPEQWRALRRVAPLGDFADARFEGLAARQAHAEEIHATLAAWMARQDPFVLEARLVREGVPAAVAQRMSDLHRDPQLAHRGFFVPLDHAEMGRVLYDGLPTRFSAKRVTLHRAAPTLGEHTDLVLREMVGLTAEEVAEYAAAGALT